MYTFFVNKKHFVKKKPPTRGGFSNFYSYVKN